MGNAARKAIEALKATAPHQFSPLPWSAVTQDGGCDVAGSDGLVVAVGCYTADAAHIAAAVNAAPHLLAALEAARVAVGKITIWDVDDHHCIEHVNPVTRGCERCDAVHGLAAARLALGLEVKP